MEPDTNTNQSNDQPEAITDSQPSVVEGAQSAAQETSPAVAAEQPLPQQPQQESQPLASEQTTPNPEPAVDDGLNNTAAQQIPPAQVVPPAPLNALNPEEGTHSYVVALVLSYLLGYFGVDRFYLGYIATGILKLITFGGFGIWYFVDFLRIGIGSLKDKQGKQLAGFHTGSHVGKPIAIILTVCGILSWLFSLFWIFFFVVFGLIFGVQSQARDAEREVNIKALSAELESVYTTANAYPTLANLNDDGWRSKNMSKLSADTFADPSDLTRPALLVPAPKAGAYAYEATNSKGEVCQGTEICVAYKLTTTYEVEDSNGNKTFVKQSINHNNQSAAEMNAAKNTYSAKTNDTKRQTDILALSSQLEVYYAINGSYPALAQLQDNAWLQNNLKGLDLSGVVAPGATSKNSISSTASLTTYQYIAKPAGCTTAAKNCTEFTLTAVRETSGSTPYVKQNLSN